MLRYLTPIMLTVAAGVAIRAWALAFSHRLPLQIILGSRLQVLLVGLALGVLLLLRAAHFEIQDLRLGRHRRETLRSMRWAFVASILGWLSFLALVQPFQRLWFDLMLGCAAGGWGAMLLVQRAAMDRHPRLLKAVDLVAFGLCASLLVLEVGLRIWASVSPSPLNATVGAGPGELVQRFRCDPGEVRFGFACNSGGFYDTEFYRRAEGDESPLIVAIGDSFNVGTVPHSWHFTTICEELIGATIFNMGVPGIGPPEYLSLLVDEALPLEPDLILIGVFVGNDLDVEDAIEDLPDRGLRAWFQRDQVLLSVLPDRMARIASERTRAEQRGSEAGIVQGERSGEEPMDRTSATAAFPWLEDPDLEEATLSAEVFYELETERALAICAQTPPSFDLFCTAMLGVKRAAGDTPLRVMLIPDEFQVEDDLWERVSARAGRELDRTRPQKLLSAWLAEQGIPCLDLLPALRQIPEGPDGRRHLYHAMDTHFNGRGNQVTAEALAEFLR